jgi:hypothetical protein
VLLEAQEALVLEGAQGGVDPERERVEELVSPAGSWRDGERDGATQSHGVKLEHAGILRFPLDPFQALGRAPRLPPIKQGFLETGPRAEADQGPGRPKEC